MDSPYEIRLIVHPQADGYRAVWTSPQGQISEEFPLTLPLQSEDIAELRWYLETYIQFPGAGDRARVQRLEARLVEWGKNLFDALLGMAEGVQVYNDLHCRYRTQSWLRRADVERFRIRTGARAGDAGVAAYYSRQTEMTANKRYVRC